MNPAVALKIAGQGGNLAVKAFRAAKKSGALKEGAKRASGFTKSARTLARFVVNTVETAPNRTEGLKAARKALESGVLIGRVGKSRRTMSRREIEEILGLLNKRHRGMAARDQKISPQELVEAISSKFDDIHLDDRVFARLRQESKGAIEEQLTKTNKGLDAVSNKFNNQVDNISDRIRQDATRIGKGAGPKAGAKGAKKGTQSGAKASQQAYQYGPQTPPPSQSAEYFPQTPPPSGRMGKLKASGKKALEYAKNNKLAVGGTLVGAAFVPQSLEALGTTMGLDPFDYQGRLAKTRNLQALPSVLDAMEQEGELIRQEGLNRGLRAGVRPVEMSDPLGDLMQDQELAAILEGKLEQLRGQGVSAQPRRLDPYEIAARLGL